MRFANLPLAAWWLLVAALQRAAPILLQKMAAVMLAVS